MSARLSTTLWVSFRTGYWAARELRAIRAGSTERDGIDAIVGIPPLADGFTGYRVARAALLMRRATCLERSLVLQQFLAVRGRPVDLIVGVRRSEAGEFEAHAWLDGFEEANEFTELRRRSP